MCWAPSVVFHLRLHLQQLFISTLRTALPIPHMLFAICLWVLLPVSSAKLIHPPRQLSFFAKSNQSCDEACAEHRYTCDVRLRDVFSRSAFNKAVESQFGTPCWAPLHDGYWRSPEMPGIDLRTSYCVGVRDLPRYSKCEAKAPGVARWCTCTRDFAIQRLLPLVTVPPTQCPIGNIDIVVVARPKDRPVLAHLFHSIGVFMKCYNTLHLVVDPEHVDLFRTRVPVDPRRSFRVHSLALVGRMDAIPGYLQQQWAMMWADKFADEAGSGATHLMFMDSDSVLGMPVTRESLFDEAGRLYQVAWEYGAGQAGFRAPCEFVLGIPCPHSYMTTFPYVLPAATLPAIREHVVRRLQSTNQLGPIEHFNQLVQMPWAARWGGLLMGIFTQFVTMGNYLRHFRPEVVRTAHCPHVDRLRHPISAEARLCLDYVVPGVHVGWGNCFYVGSCAPMAGTNTAPPADFVFLGSLGDRGRHDGKYSSQYDDTVQDVMEYGRCWAPPRGRKRPSHCTDPPVVHQAMRVYMAGHGISNYHPNMSLAREMYNYR